MPSWCGLSLRIHSRMEEVKCFEMSGVVVLLALVTPAFD